MYELSYKQIIKLSLKSYNFVLYNMEVLNESTVEFSHIHPVFELFYAWKGDLKLRLDDEEIFLNTGDIAILSPGLAHQVLNSTSTERTYFILLFDFKPNPNLRSANINEEREITTILNCILREKYVHFNANCDSGLHVEKISHEMQQKSIGWSTYVNVISYCFLLDALRYFKMEQSPSDNAGDQFNLAIEATKYIHEHYTENISVDTLAKYLNISPRHVNRVFYHMFGTTFGKTLRTLRLAYAKSLLAKEKISLEELAVRVGYSSAQSLHKAFKQSEGMTPGEFTRNKS